MGHLQVNGYLKLNYMIFGTAAKWSKEISMSTVDVKLGSDSSVYH